jgi:membrane protease YdiL (CAAX protease family)
MQRPGHPGLRSAIEILLALGVVTSIPATVIVGDPLRSMRALAAFTTLSSALLLALLAILQRLRGEPVLESFVRRDRMKRDTLIGALVAPTWFVLIFITIALVGLLGLLGLRPPDAAAASPVLALMRTPGEFALFLLVALLTGGVTEELQRAFVIRRFEAWGPAWLGAALYGAWFGVGHLGQGVGGAVFSGLFGFGHGLLFIRRGSVIAPIVSHGLYDVLEITRHYLFGPLLS